MQQSCSQNILLRTVSSLLTESTLGLFSNQLYQFTFKFNWVHLNTGPLFEIPLLFHFQVHYRRLFEFSRVHYLLRFQVYFSTPIDSTSEVYFSSPILSPLITIFFHVHFCLLSTLFSRSTFWGPFTFDSIFNILTTNSLKTLLHCARIHCTMLA